MSITSYSRGVETARPERPTSVERETIERREWIRGGLLAGAVLADSLAIAAAAMTATILRFGHLDAGRTEEMLLAILPIYLLAGWKFDAFVFAALRSAPRSAYRSVLALATAAVFALVPAFAFKVTSEFSRLETGYMLAAAALYLGAGRVFGARLLSGVRQWLEPHIIVLTSGLGSPQARGDRPAGTVINVRRRNWTPTHTDSAFLEQVFEAVQHADRIVLDFSSADERHAWSEVMRLMGVHAELVEPELARVAPVGLGRWGGQPTLVVSRGPLTVSERFAKPAMDLGLTVLGLALLLPVLAVVALLIKLDSPGPILFAQTRVGRNNRHYRCYKFRTMRAELSDACGDRSASRDDDRVTRIGRFLRRTSLDELPQLWNVLKGDMSLVGPRPHALGSTAEGALFWEVVPGYWGRHAMKPGVTGLAQVRGFRGATHSRRDIELRVASDLEYISGWSLLLDLRILLRTMTVVFHRNAY
jgi:polysaccharide biosynthesis protein PslA